MKQELFVVAGAIVKDHKVFIAQRGNKGKTAFKWEFPGGKIEKGETPQEAIRRELKEELSVDVDVHERLTSIIDEYDTVILHVDTFICTLKSGEPVLNEHIACAWSFPKDLGQYDFSKADAPTITKLQEILE